MSNSKQLSRSDLLSASTRMKSSLRILKEINSKANLIAFNAAIEGARTRGRLDSFSIVAEQILTQAFRQLELTEQLEKLADRLHNVALSSTAARYYEMAVDLIDMLDRNLFERNCDCQAWTTFDVNVKCLEEVKQLKKEMGIKFDYEAILNAKYVLNSCDLLNKIMKTYVVYSDIYCIDEDGYIVSSANHGELIGKKNFKNATWFQKAMTGEVSVSDMVWCDEVEGYSVFYTAPVRSSTGDIIGVLSTRFNWNYAQEMIDTNGYDKNVEAFIINRSGLVLASTEKIDTYKDMLHWLDSGKESIRGNSGYTIETARNGAAMAVGFARTKGYNAYKGKEWSAIITSRLGNVDYEHLVYKVKQGKSSDESDSNNKIESEICNEELIRCMKDINDLVEQINKTNNETDMLAINAAIQAGIAGTEGESFAVIAGEIGSLAEKSVGFVVEVNNTTKDLQDAVSKTVAARLSDAAKDAISKVDRNLFERYCDVQAFATFSLVKDAVTGKNVDDKCNKLLENIHRIYEIYHDIILCDVQGRIVSCGVKRELIGQNQSNRTWFQEAIHGKVAVSELYYSSSVNGLCLSYSAPVYDDNGNIIGVISTRFNWNFIYDIIDAVIVDSQSEVNLINSDGLLIGSTNRDGIMKKTYKHLRSFKELSNGKSGHLTEVDPDDGKEYSVGFCKTSGYNTYAGKGWSIIIRRLL